MQKAVANWRDWHKETPAESLAFFLALAPDEAGDAKGRDQMLAGLAAKKAVLGYLAGQFRDCLAQGEKAKPDPAAVEQLLGLVSGKLKEHARYFVGCFLDQRGHGQAALEHLGQVAAAEVLGNDEVRVMAAVRVRARGVDPQKLPAPK
jgi:hypothetical protein